MQWREREREEKRERDCSNERAVENSLSEKFLLLRSIENRGYYSDMTPRASRIVSVAAPLSIRGGKSAQVLPGN